MLNQAADLDRLFQALADPCPVWSQEIRRARTCAINPGALESAKRWMAKRRSLWERRLDRIGDYLADAARSGPPRTPDKKHHDHPDHPEEKQ
jgi:hypothetical protein